MIMISPRTNTWARLPDMLVPRIQPTVVAYSGMIYAMGGRNSNKVVMCGLTHSWVMHVFAARLS